MPDSIRERIEKQVRAKLMTDLDLPARDVQRVERDGNDVTANPDTGELPGHWILITASDEDIDTEEYALGTTEKVLPLTIDIHVIKVGSGLSMAEHANALRAQVEQSLLADPQWTETATGVELALESFIVGTYGPMPGYESAGGGAVGGALTGVGVRDWLVGVELEIRYRHGQADPYSII